MTSELYIENYRLDISNCISSLINFELDNIRDFASRGTSWSKTIVLPGTANNNKRFGHIFQIGQANSYDNEVVNANYNFNASKSADCLIFQDQFQTFKGVIRLLQINIIKGRIEYEVAVFGELALLNVELSSRKLEDLDFSAYNHTYTTANILASWNNSGGSGYYYPLVDYGQVSTGKHDWDLKAFRPALYVKEYIDKMFEQAGFRYDSDLFDTTRFKSLIVPVNLKNLMKASDFSFYVDAPFHEYDGDSDPLIQVPFSNHVLLTGFTANVTSTEFTATASVVGNLVANVTGLYTKTLGSTLKFRFIKNGLFEMDVETFGTGTTSGSFNINLVCSTSIISGDIISVEFDGPATYTLELDNGYIRVDQNTLIDIGLDDLVEMNFTIPKNIRQLDFLVSIVKLFNLYVYEDKFDNRLIYIKPYVDFYSTDSSNAVDWTYKLNRGKNISIKPMSELNARKYEFKYKSDSDYYNELYRKRYNQGYGDYVFDSEFEFSEQSKAFEIIFSATPLVGYGGEEKLMPTIFKKTNDLEERIDSNIRILQSKKVVGVVSWNIMNGVSVLVSTTDYGYAGHLDDPDVPDNDLNFGALRELFFTLVTGDLSKTQFNLYWSSYMAEITDKDSKLMSAWFYLKPNDILNLDFSKYVYVDGVLFRLNKIGDYNSTRPSDCLVELFKVGYTSYIDSGGVVAPTLSYYLLWEDGGVMLHEDGGKLLYA